MRVHLIAIGGSAMHNIALALHNKGYKVTGSDDTIYEPSKTRLQKHGFAPLALDGLTLSELPLWSQIYAARVLGYVEY